MCAHKDRKVIDAMIADHVPYLEIAGKFKLNHRTVNRHGTNHVRPFMDSVERQAQVAVLARMMAYRDVVNLPLLEKSKYIENKLWGDYADAINTVDRLAVIREIQKQQTEQAKLAGAYQKIRPNESDVAKTVRGYQRWVSDYPDATVEEKRQWLTWFAEGAGIDEAELARSIQVQEITQTLQ